MKYLLVTLIGLTAAVQSGCARTEKVVAHEEANPGVYESLGTLEISEPARYITASGAFWSGVNIATLTLADTPSRGEIYKKMLRKKLAQLAEDRYGADAVINVTYWPDPESARFPEGQIHARGEMVKYYKFPPAAPAAEISPEAAPVLAA